MNIVFFGSDLFGIPSLEGLKEISNLLIVSEPDKPVGRGRKLFPLPPKQYALTNNITFIETNNCNENESVERITQFKPDFFVVASFGQILKKRLLKIPKYMPLNIHPSLLPKYRGAAPIRRAILNGERKTGVSIIKMVKELDSGEILIQKEIPLKDNDIYTELFEKLSELGAELIIKSIDLVINNNYEITEQNNSLATYADKISSNDLKLDIHRGMELVLRQINAFSEKPGVRFSIRGKQFKIIRATDSNIKLDTGVFSVIDNRLYIGTKTYAIEVLKIQPAGKKVMDARIFINGYKTDKNLKVDEV